MDAALRILDANLNRAREGLRTAEEYARLALSDAVLSGRCKALRGLLKDMIDQDASLAARLLAARDVQHDVGLAIDGGAARLDLADVARAGIKRAQEALRVIEECAKAVAPVAASLAARARYEAYALEQQLFAAGPARKLLRESPLMVVFTRSQCRNWQQTLAALHQAGARLFQLREKEASARDFAAYAREFIARAADSVVLINDRADIAGAVGASGVHLGQADLTVSDARHSQGPAGLVGVSTHNATEAKAAAEAGADYIGLGAMFPTASKKVESTATPQQVREVLATATLPVFCIGGVGPANLAALRELGVRQVAAGSSIVGAESPGAAWQAMAKGLQP